MNSNLVGLGEYKILTEDDHFGYTRDVHSCIAIIFHRKSSAVLTHIEAYDETILLNPLVEIIELDDDEIQYAEIFKGKYTSPKNLELVISILNSLGVKNVVYDIFTNFSNQTSIGFDYVKNEHYLVNEEVDSLKLSRRIPKIPND